MTFDEILRERKIGEELQARAKEIEKLNRTAVADELHAIVCRKQHNDPSKENYCGFRTNAWRKPVKELTPEQNNWLAKADITLDLMRNWRLNPEYFKEFLSVLAVIVR